MPKPRKPRESADKKQRPASLTGSTSANFHEGTRSEYLAHYVLASFGTAIPVPSREDTGLDLLCTLTERIEQRIWPLEYYSVQVKSTEDDWHFDSTKSVEWFIKYPQPIFLCVVIKSEARLRFYHTLPRYSVWATPVLPKEITLRPEPENGIEGTIVEWDSGTTIGLGSPILDFCIQDTTSSDNMKNYAQVLKSWIQVEKENLFRISANVRSFLYPNCYLTNVALHDFDGSVAEGKEWRPVGTEEDKITAQRVQIPIAWLTYQLSEKGDIAGATKGALLLRHLFGDEQQLPLTVLHGRLTAALGTDGRDFAGIDLVAEAVDALVQKVSRCFS